MSLKLKDPLDQRNIDMLVKSHEIWKKSKRTFVGTVLPFLAKYVSGYTPRNTGKRYYHRCIVVPPPLSQVPFVFSSEEKAKAWKKATEESVSHPEVLIDKIERPTKEGWMM